MFKINKKISEDIIKHTNAIHVSDLYVKNNHYYVKPDQERKEVIAYQLAKQGGLCAVPYESVLVRHKYYSVSKDIKESGRFILALDLFGDIISLTDLICKIRNLYFYTEELEWEFYQMYFFDFLFLNTDRYTRNYGFVEVLDRWHLVLFDHKSTFDVIGTPALKYHPENFTQNTISFYYQDFLLFYDVLPFQVKEEFRRMIELYDEELVRKIIAEYTDEVNDYMMIYLPHYQKIKSILNRGVKHER